MHVIVCTISHPYSSMKILHTHEDITIAPYLCVYLTSSEKFRIKYHELDKKIMYDFHVETLGVTISDESKIRSRHSINGIDRV